MRVASKDLHSEFGHARSLGSRVIRYVRDGRTDRQKETLLPPSYGRGIETATHAMHAHEKRNPRKDRIGCVHALRISVFFIASLAVPALRVLRTTA